ncbi:thioredoxin family protein [Sphingobacterium siyangense]|uniref:thioredoxin family protein n=2 Tax=Sphingobacterium siyangense TaxID=459529 RepID=UPI00191B8768|nr:MULTISPECIES: thioredoxin-like domain-containing protein [Sphingobacterium]QQT30810.1 hypothetical protein I6I99_26605 [Sphingobacterium multivorum]
MKSIYLYLACMLSISLFACQGNGRYPDKQQGKLKASPAAYEFIDIEGTRHLLKDIRGKYKLLLFYDPAAAESQQEVVAMKQSVPLAHLIASGKVNVLAICASGDLSFWSTYQKHIPSRWINGFDIKGETRMKSYFGINSFPRLVLLDDKNELVKMAVSHDSLIALLEN